MKLRNVASIEARFSMLLVLRERFQALLRPSSGRRFGRSRRSLAGAGRQWGWSGDDHLEGTHDLGLLIDAIPAVVWSASADGIPEFFNTHYLEYVGLTFDKALRTGLDQAVHPDDVPTLSAVWCSLKRSGLAGEAEARLRRHDGVYRWFLCCLSPSFDRTGAILRWYGTCMDIEERKIAEAELRLSEAFLAQGQRLTSTGSMWWDVHAGAITWSEETYRQMEYPSSMKPTFEMAIKRCHPEDVERVAATIAEGARNGTNIDIEHRLLMPTGVIKHLRVVLQNIATRDRPVYVGAITNITNWKLAEERARRGEMLLTAGERISKTGTFSWQLDTGELTLSHELRRIYGFSDSDTVTIEKIVECVHPDDLSVVNEKRERTRSGQGNSEYHIRLVTNDNQIRHVRVISQPVLHEDGRRECLGAVQDVTSQRQTEEALDQLRNELARATGAMSLAEMAASIAHEVNQPLSGIVTNAGTTIRLLSARVPDVDRALEASRRGLRDANRAAEVVQRLRALFQKSPVVMTPMDLNEAASEVVTLLANAFRRARVEISLDLAIDPPPIAGDRVQIQQVVMNFLKNATEALEAVNNRPKRIWLTTEVRADGDVTLLVKDNGPGLTAGQEARVFQPFYTRKPQGMGIGLSLSRSIIEHHQGRIFADTSHTMGASFGFSVPSLTAVRQLAMGTSSYKECTDDLSARNQGKGWPEATIDPAEQLSVSNGPGRKCGRSASVDGDACNDRQPPRHLALATTDSDHGCQGHTQHRSLDNDHPAGTAQIGLRCP